jgi:hypothetical protein
VTTTEVALAVLVAFGLGLVGLYAVLGWIASSAEKAISAVVGAAYALRDVEREFDRLPWQERSACATLFVEDQAIARERLDAALARLERLR